MTKPAVPTLNQIAARIQEHLKRLALLPENVGLIVRPSVNKVGVRVYVRYVCTQISTSLTKPQALQYLAYLDGGGTGTHFGKENDGEG